MNKIKIAMAVAMLVASPAFAQPSQHALSRPQSATVASDVVIVGDQYIGQDPDPYVRAELRRDYNDYLGN